MTGLLPHTGQLIGIHCEKCTEQCSTGSITKTKKKKKMEVKCSKYKIFEIPTTTATKTIVLICVHQRLVCVIESHVAKDGESRDEREANEADALTGTD